MLLAFTVSAMAQSTVPKPMNPIMDYWEEAWGTSQEFMYTIIPMSVDYEFLDQDCMSYSVYLDNDEIFVFTPEEFPRDFTEPTTIVPVNKTGFFNDGTTFHFENRNAITATENPFFTWRIGMQVHYTVDGVTNSSDIVYLEVFPQMHAATQVTSTSFLADWSSEPNCYQHAGFVGYDLYITNKATQETIVIDSIPSLVGTRPFAWYDTEEEVEIAGGTYLVEGLTPGATYEYYVVSRHHWGEPTVDIPSNVMEVTLPNAVIMSDPVMLPADPDYVEPTAFMAEWTNETPAQYVTDYTLYVNAGNAAPTALLTEAFGGVTATSDGTARIDSNLDTYCDNAGWTGTYVYQAGGGGLKFGNSSNGGGLTTPALDLTNSNGTVTVTFNAKNYGTDATTVTVTCGEVSETVELTGEATDYTVTLEGVTAAADQQITITSSGSKQRWYLYNVNISVPGAGEGYVFEHITDMGYVVTDLTPGETYTYYVVANYTDGTNGTSNTQQVTLPMPATPELIADPETLTMEANVGGTVTATFDILGTDLTNDVTITIASESGMLPLL